MYPLYEPGASDARRHITSVYLFIVGLLVGGKHLVVGAHLVCRAHMKDIADAQVAQSNF